MNQIELHHTIDKLIENNPNKVGVDEVSKVIYTNDDSRQYFFEKVGADWLAWLWKQGFLDVIKEKAQDPDSYGYRMPELKYLFRVVDKVPEKVAKFICSFPITAKNFNPEVIDQFTRVASKLPASDLKKVVKKINSEQWLKLMGSYTQYGFDYEDMFKILKENDDEESILVLAEAILLIRSVSDRKKRKISYRGDNVFYIQDIGETKVFSYLARIDDVYLERALSLLTQVFIAIISDEGDYLLMDEDLFTLTLSSAVEDHYQEDIKLIVATIIELVRRVFSSRKHSAKKIFRKYFSNLPNKQISRRLRLSILSQSPRLFVAELTAEYFELLKTKKITSIFYGAEYERSLKAGFSYLDETSRRKYIDGIFELFTKEKSELDARWDRHYASCILSSISSSLSEQDKEKAQAAGFNIDPQYQPEPSIGKITGGTVNPRSPIPDDDFSVMSIPELVDKLKGELSPEQIKTRYKDEEDDEKFLHPRNAEGVASQLREDISNRLQDYLTNATLFFDRNSLSSHYTYNYLRGILEVFSNNQIAFDNIDFSKLFDLLNTIKKSGSDNPFTTKDKQAYSGWLVGWNSVHSTIAALIEELIKSRENKTIIEFTTYRDKILAILTYLLKYNNPTPEDEKEGTARLKSKDSGDKEYTISDPYSIAINSVRGQAYEALLHFIYQDSKGERKSFLAGDIKSLYKSILKEENTRAMMFMFGHYLASFYYRDKEWMCEVINQIFRSKKDKYLNLAAWEGYLSKDLYQELFFEPTMQELYTQSITQKLSYPGQKFYKDPHESVAIHIALAFVHYEDFGFEHPLFERFINKADEKQLSEFIRFIGKSYISGGSYLAIKGQENAWRKNRLQDFWDYMLVNKSDSSSIVHFGMWINTETEVFDINWLAQKINATLMITKGKLDWDYGLMKSITTLASQTPTETIDILKLHFLNQISSKEYNLPIREDKEWYQAFEVLYGYQDQEIKIATTDLISLLIEKGSQPYWELEKIISQ